MADTSRPNEIMSALLEREAQSGAPIFAEPWQAQAFALTVALHEKGLFAWPEWSTALSEEIAAFTASGQEDYFLCWLGALEKLLIGKGLADTDNLAELVAGWDKAYRTTPHGKPVQLADQT